MEVQASPVAAIEQEPSAFADEEEVKVPTKLVSQPQPTPTKLAESSEMALLGEKRPRPAKDLTDINADIALLFKARDTMKQAKKEYDGARKVIKLLFEPIKQAFDMPAIDGSKPNSPKE